MSPHKRLAVLFAMIVSSFTFASVALAADSPWTLTTGSGTYDGFCSFNLDTGWLNCHGMLVSGSPEDSSAVIIQSGTCTLVLAPSGQANMNCRKQ